MEAKATVLRQPAAVLLLLLVPLLAPKAQKVKATALLNMLIARVLALAEDLVMTETTIQIESEISRTSLKTTKSLENSSRQPSAQSLSSGSVHHSKTRLLFR